MNNSLKISDSNESHRGIMVFMLVLFIFGLVYAIPEIINFAQVCYDNFCQQIAAFRPY